MGAALVQCGVGLYRTFETGTKPVELPAALQKIADAARPWYEKMRPYRLT